MMAGEPETMRARYTFTSEGFMEKKREFFLAHFFTGDHYAVVPVSTDTKKRCNYFSSVEMIEELF